MAGASGADTTSSASTNALQSRHLPVLQGLPAGVLLPGRALWRDFGTLLKGQAGRGRGGRGLYLLCLRPSNRPAIVRLDSESSADEFRSHTLGTIDRAALVNQPGWEAAAEATCKLRSRWPGRQLPRHGSHG